MNRNSDGIGSNSPIYGAMFGASNNCTNAAAAPLLDCADYNAYVAEYGQNFVNANGFTPEFATDVVNESAFKTGIQYTFDFGLSVSTIYEYLKRFLPADSNSRTSVRETAGGSRPPRISSWDDVSIGWAHAGRTPGDPAGQHNYSPDQHRDYANMYTAAWKHRFDKSLYAYLDAAETVNHGNAHYDLGAGGRA